MILKKKQLQDSHGFFLSKKTNLKYGNLFKTKTKTQNMLIYEMYGN